MGLLDACGATDIPQDGLVSCRQRSEDCSAIVGYIQYIKRWSAGAHTKWLHRRYLRPQLQETATNLHLFRDHRDAMEQYVEKTGR